MARYQWTEAQRDALAAAIAKGVKRVTADGLTQEFQSLDDMRALLATMDDQLTAAPLNRLLTSRKGLGQY